MRKEKVKVEIKEGKKYTVFAVSEMIAITSKGEFTAKGEHKGQPIIQFRNKRKKHILEPNTETLIMEGWDLPIKADSEYGRFVGNAKMNLTSETMNREQIKEYIEKNNINKEMNKSIITAGKPAEPDTFEPLYETEEPKAEQREESKEEHKDDLELSQLEQFYGTENYYDIYGINATDGVKYIMDNGYSWLVTDAIAVIKTKLRGQPFLCVKLEREPNEKAQMTITDGNETQLYKQKYQYTTAKKDLKLFCCDNVLMLNSEY